jgi:hypothetical protein
MDFAQPPPNMSLPPPNLGPQNNMNMPPPNATGQGNAFSKF